MPVRRMQDPGVHLSTKGDHEQMCAVKYRGINILDKLLSVSFNLLLRE